MSCFCNTPNLSQSYGFVYTKWGKWPKLNFREIYDMTINFVIHWSLYKKIMTQIGLSGENMSRTLHLLVGLL